MRSLFVTVHEPRIARHVGGQYRRQPALDPDWPFLHHDPQPNHSVLYDGSETSANARFDWMPTQAAQSNGPGMSALAPLLGVRRTSPPLSMDEYTP